MDGDILERIMSWASVTIDESVEEKNDRWLFITPRNQDEIKSYQLDNVYELQKAFTIALGCGDEDTFISIRLR